MVSVCHGLSPNVSPGSVPRPQAVGGQKIRVADSTGAVGRVIDTEERPGCVRVPAKDDSDVSPAACPRVARLDRSVEVDFKLDAAGGHTTRSVRTLEPVGREQLADLGITESLVAKGTCGRATATANSERPVGEIALANANTPIIVQNHLRRRCPAPVALFLPDHRNSERFRSPDCRDWNRSRIRCSQRHDISFCSSRNNPVDGCASPCSGCDHVRIPMSSRSTEMTAWPCTRKYLQSSPRPGTAPLPTTSMHCAVTSFAIGVLALQVIHALPPGLSARRREEKNAGKVVRARERDRVLHEMHFPRRCTARPGALMGCQCYRLFVP